MFDADTSRASLVVFAMSLVISAAGFWYFLCKPLHRRERLPVPQANAEPPSGEVEQQNDEIRALWASVLILVFFFLCSAVVGPGVFWSLRMPAVGFLADKADPARVIYETRSILGYAAAIVASCLAIFTPILLWLWLHAKQRVEERLARLLAYRNNASVNQSQLDKQIEFERSVLARLASVGDSYRTFFYLTILVMAGLLFLLALVNFIGSTNVATYVWAVWLFVASILLFLWMLALLLTYEIRVQPLVRDHGSLFALLDLTARR